MITKEIDINGEKFFLHLLIRS